MKRMIAEGNRFFKDDFLGLLIGYMLTWTTYGSWLQGEEKGFVKEGLSCGSDTRLLRANKKRLQNVAMKLDCKQKQIVVDEIFKVAKRLGQRVYSVAVCSNHVHLVVSNVDAQVSDVVRRYKKNATFALKESGLEGKVWTRGYDKRFCYDEKSLQARIEYVERHSEG